MGLVTAGIGWADAVAALVVVGLIGRAGLEVIRQAAGVLVDTAPYTPERLIAIAESLPSVDKVLRARSRGSANAAHIDLDIEVAPAMTADHTAAITEAVREALNEALHGVEEVEVHFVPTPPQDAGQNYPLLVRAQADALGLATHEVQVTQVGFGKTLEMHVEVPPGQTLDSAHEQVTALEKKLRATLPEIGEIVTHIEPAQTEQINGTRAAGSRTIEAEARTLLEKRYPAIAWHDFRAVPLNGGYGLTLHVTLPGSLPVERAHSVAEEAEVLLRSELPRLARVTIHTEPPD
jgi:divalent metal cation (Fe/Co/Zn/Cd) transporter